MLTLKGIKVMSANTDGIVCLFNKDQEEVYNKVCNEWEEKVGNNEMGKLEYVDYKLFAQLSVNDYIAIKSDGEPKHKGSFMIDYELHKNKSFKIIPLALEAYYKDGLNPARFIREHNNIFNFCAGIRAKSEWWFESRWYDEELKIRKEQQTVRYFISNSGSKLIKCHNDGRELQVNAGKHLSTIYNKHNKRNIKEYNVDYEFYINKVYDVIHKIEPDVINKNFTQMSLF